MSLFVLLFGISQNVIYAKECLHFLHLAQPSLDFYSSESEISQDLNKHFYNTELQNKVDRLMIIVNIFVKTI